MPAGGALTAGAIAAPIVGGIMGQQAQAGNLAAAQAAYAAALAQYQSVGIPSVQAQQLALQDPTVQGTLNPQMINSQLNQMNGNAMNSIQTDPRLAQAQMSALNTLSQTGQQGLTATSLAALNSANRQAAGQNTAQQNSIVQNMQQRGMGGSGVELATRLAAAQGSADQAGQQTSQIMAQAQQNMLNATSQAGQLGGQMQQQQFGEAAQKAQAQNAISQFNAQQAANAQNSNVLAQNQAQAANLSNAQNIANMSTATQNAEQQYNSGLLQTNFGNNMQLAGAKAGALVGQAGNLNNQAQQTGALYSGVGAGLGQGLMGAATMASNPYSGTSPTLASTGSGTTSANYTMPSFGATPASSSTFTPTTNSSGSTLGNDYSFSKGGLVPGLAIKHGDSEENDTVHARLSPGELVIPRSHAISSDLAKAYIDHLFKVAKGKS
jgi:hypothetical protein